jgi:hypothetical protein
MKLLRFGHKGQFVAYPKHWDQRMVNTGLRRHMTRCDMLVGNCACGQRHFEDDEWVEECLRFYHDTIEGHGEWLERTRCCEK